MTKPREFYFPGSWCGYWNLSVSLHTMTPRKEIRFANNRGLLHGHSRPCIRSISGCCRGCCQVVDKGEHNWNLFFLKLYSSILLDDLFIPLCKNIAFLRCFYLVANVTHFLRLCDIFLTKLEKSLFRLFSDREHQSARLVAVIERLDVGGLWLREDPALAPEIPIDRIDEVV